MRAFDIVKPQVLPGRSTRLGYIAVGGKKASWWLIVRHNIFYENVVALDSLVIHAHGDFHIFQHLD